MSVVTRGSGPTVGWTMDKNYFDPKQSSDSKGNYDVLSMHFF